MDEYGIVRGSNDGKYYDNEMMLKWTGLVML